MSSYLSSSLLLSFPSALSSVLSPPSPRALHLQTLPQSFVLLDELQQCGISATDLKVRAFVELAYRRLLVLPPSPSRARPLLTTLTSLFTIKNFCPTSSQKVRDAGFATVKSLLTVPKKTLIEVKGMSDAKVDKLLEAACKLLPAVQAGAFVTAGEWIDMVRARESSSFSYSPATPPRFFCLSSAFLSLSLAPPLPRLSTHSRSR